MTTDWALLGAPPPDTLTEPRLQLHRALQLVPAVGDAYVRPAQDYSHSSAQWSTEHRVLIGNPTDTDPVLRVGLAPAQLALVVHDDRGTELMRYMLDGSSIEETYAWLQSVIAQRLRSDPKPLVRSELELPPGPGAGESRFVLDDPPAFEELARWYGNADLLLGGLRKSTPEASPVRCWPHHFDIAFLLPMGEVSSDEGARSIGVGMTPGDDSYAVPYWYVTPWPYPKSPDLPELPAGGEWHTQDWVGAILTADRLTKSSAREQQRQVEDFVGAAVRACRKMLLG